MSTTQPGLARRRRACTPSASSAAKKNGHVPLAPQITARVIIKGSVAHLAGLKRVHAVEQVLREALFKHLGEAPGARHLHHDAHALAEDKGKGDDGAEEVGGKERLGVVRHDVAVPCTALARVRFVEHARRRPTSDAGG